MTIGEKLKKLRLLRGMTQGELAGDTTSRNMICQIERGAGNPSLQTLKHLAKVLEVDPGYFLCEEDDLTQYLISAAMPKIQQALKQGKLRECIRLCQPFTEEDNDELMHILAICYRRCGYENFEVGYLESARSDLLLARQYATRSIYASYELMQIEICLEALEEYAGSQMPHSARTFESMRYVYETVLYRRILELISRGKADNAAVIYDLLSPETVHYRRHINARLSMARYNYERAKVLLNEIIRDKEKSGISVPFLMQIWRDLELCCKSTGDIEGAYRCAKQIHAFSENTHH